MLKDYPDVLTIDDLMEILHYKSKTTVYRLLRGVKIKAVHEKRGNRYLIPKKSVVDYLLDNKD